jgi:hypothetical protein
MERQCTKLAPGDIASLRSETGNTHRSPHCEGVCSCFAGKQFARPAGAPLMGVGARISAVGSQPVKRTKDGSPWRKPWVDWYATAPVPHKGQKKSRLEPAAQSFYLSVVTKGWGRTITATFVSFAPLGLGELWSGLCTHSSRYGLRSFARFTGSPHLPHKYPTMYAPPAISKP